MFKQDILLFLIAFKDRFFKSLPFKFLPINNKKIVFSNYLGFGYGCNPKYIAEEILNTRKDLKLVWIVDSKKGDFKFPKGIEKVDNIIQALFELATAKIWVDNYHKVNFIKKHLQKRKGQYYIQTWHGSLGIKKIEADVHSLTNTKNWKNEALANASMQDFLISNSDFEDDVYKSAFWNKGEILKIGHARNDIFFKDNANLKQRILEFYNLKKDTKILIYAPTFRQGYSCETYNINYPNLKRALEEKFKGEWVIFVRMHKNICKRFDFSKEEFIIDVSDYDDMQELMAISDVLITDYSSCIFDFMLSRKPAFIYATDIEKYEKERGFYYSIYDTPFLVAKNNTELVANITSFDGEIYQLDVEKFLLGKGCIDDGKASIRIAKLITNLLEK